MRPERLFLLDIQAACRKIKSITASSSESHFSTDDVSYAAMLHHLTVIGEASGRISAELKQRYPNVAWRQIVATRHRIVHAYFDLDWQILWEAATSEVPELSDQIQNILDSEFPDLQ